MWFAIIFFQPTVYHFNSVFQRIQALNFDEVQVNKTFVVSWIMLMMCMWEIFAKPTVVKVSPYVYAWKCYSVRFHICVCDPFWVVFVYGLRDRSEVHLSMYECATVPAPLVKKTLLSPLNCCPPSVSYTHLTLPTTGSLCRSRWSPYH